MQGACDLWVAKQRSKAVIRKVRPLREVFIRRDGESVVLTPRPNDWSGLFALGFKASPDFMAQAERMPVQEQ